MNRRTGVKSAIREALLTASETYLRWEEFPSGKGIADILYFPKKYTRTPAILMELKMNRSAKSAIKQIKDRNYPERLKDYGGEILLVGISYNSKSQKHKCIIEEFDMKKGTVISPAEKLSAQTSKRTAPDQRLVGVSPAAMDPSDAV